MTDADQQRAWAEAGLYDAAAPEAADRLEVLGFLASQGVTVAEMQDALRIGELVSAAADKQIVEPATLTKVEAAERTGLSEEQIDRAWLAVGLPPVPRDELAFREGDLELLSAFAIGSELFGFDALLQFSRVLGSSLARIADAAVSSFLVNVQRPIDLEHGRPVELAKANTLGVGLLVDLPRLSAPLFRRLAWDAIRRTRGRDPDSYDVFVLSVAFLDLVDYTAWSHSLAPGDLARAVNDFEQAASDAVIHAGARMVKNIGDAVMFVAEAPAVAARVALDLCGFVERHPTLTQLRAAMATGELLGRDGDWYGPTVNRAARLVKEAAPGTLVSDRPVPGRTSTRRDDAHLRGIAEPVPLYEIS